MFFKGLKRGSELILNQTKTYTMVNIQRNTEIHDTNTEQSQKHFPGSICSFLVALIEFQIIN